MLKPHIEFYVKAIVYCSTHSARLTLDQMDAIVAAHPELHTSILQADSAAVAGDLRACQANLRTWMRTWKAAADAALTPPARTPELVNEHDAVEYTKAFLAKPVATETLEFPD